MHARFAEPEPESPSPDNMDKIEAEPLETRIEQFKQNSSNMAALNEFIDEVVQQAETEASKQQNKLEASKSQQGKEKRQSFAIPDFKNGKVVNRARGFVVRIFDAICNCANNNAAAATTRFKLRSGSGSGGVGGNKRQQSQGEDGEPEILALSGKKKSCNADPKKKGKGVTMADDVEGGARLVE
ncbi:uncharacterized protein LOC115630566 [Scaptodrosophila lebanonensis]|uniref:Uncharacterized protein LOC115630566 n=1 Tax=Drosophila lebanonensis TaxID=7225 RepID=A0A6J2U526_DROLE|nr:uncharacterized protein LOC115630566 [Scaptodrosophila lebanonensis]